MSDVCARVMWIYGILTLCEWDVRRKWLYRRNSFVYLWHYIDLQTTYNISFVTCIQLFLRRINNYSLVWKSGCTNEHSSRESLLGIGSELDPRLVKEIRANDRVLFFFFFLSNLTVLCDTLLFETIRVSAWQGHVPQRRADREIAAGPHHLLEAGARGRH